MAYEEKKSEKKKTKKKKKHYCTVGWNEVKRNSYFFFWNSKTTEPVCVAIMEFPRPHRDRPPTHEWSTDRTAQGHRLNTDQHSCSGQV